MQLVSCLSNRSPPNPHLLAVGFEEGRGGRGNVMNCTAEAISLSEVGGEGRGGGESTRE